MRFVPGFMRSEVAVASRYFDEVYYVTHVAFTDEPFLRQFPNVRLVRPSAARRRLLFVFSPLRSLLRPCVWRDVIKARKPALLVQHLSMLFVSDCLIEASRGVLSELQAKGTDIYLLATWFKWEAIAAAYMRQKVSCRRVVSLAHSFEIHPGRDPYLQYRFNEYKLQHIDEVHFIASTMRELYFEGCAPLHLRERYGHKTFVSYLGSIRHGAATCRPSTDGVLRLVTCSRVVGLKRLPLVAQALKLWTGRPVVWTHLGDGSEMDTLREQARDLMAANPRVRVQLTGRVDNARVVAYYAEEPVDLFLNVSTVEGLPIAIIEAMSEGVPCVATDVGGTHEIVTRETGFLLPADLTPALLLDAIRRYDALAPERKAEYRRQALRMWTERFDAEKNMSAFYEHMLQA